jgi:hypothetical protein
VAPCTPPLGSPKTPSDRDPGLERSIAWSEPAPAQLLTSCRKSRSQVVCPEALSPDQRRSPTPGVVPSIPPDQARSRSTLIGSLVWPLKKLLRPKSAGPRPAPLPRPSTALSSPSRARPYRLPPPTRRDPRQPARPDHSGLAGTRWATTAVAEQEHVIAREQDALSERF